MRFSRPFGTLALSTCCILGLTLPPATAQECVEAPDSLIAWWPLDGSFEDGAGEFGATPHGGAAFGDGMAYAGLELRDENDYLTVPDSPELNFGTGSFSVHAWVYLRSVGPTRYAPIVCKRFEEEWTRGWILLRSAYQGRWHFFVGHGGPPHKGVNVFSNEPARLNEFVHLVAVVDRSRSHLKLYVNGRLQGPPGGVRWLGSVDNAAPVQIGRAAYHGTPIGWDGVIDEVALFDRVLTSDEVADLYYAGALGMCRSWAVQIDVRPGSYPNPVNLRARGVLPVAILSSETFDALSVDPASLDLAGAPVATVGRGDRPLAHPEDVDDDGLFDLVVHFRIQDLDPAQLAEGLAYLSGMTLDGQGFVASDEVELVGGGRRSGR